MENQCRSLLKSGLEGYCQYINKAADEGGFSIIGLVGFEPTVSWSRTGWRVPIATYNPISIG
jgi:hypothetical protein